MAGIYKSYINEYIDFKKSLGFKYKTEEGIFNNFDQFTIKRNEKNVGITRELAEAWRNLNPNESCSYKYHRCICINQLASYLSKLGVKSHILRLPVNKPNFVPYIFSNSEMAALFNSCDNVRANKKRMDTAVIILPCLIRLLYGTGLRISEALALKNDDVRLSDNYLVIRDSKNGKERMIPISQSLSDVLQEYCKQKSLLPLLKEVCDHFFTTLDGRACNTDHVRKWFKKILWTAKIHLRNSGPRLHDLRHTFSVHALAKMAEDEIDLYCSLPILSSYLGHQSLEATNGYVRLTAEMYPGLLKDVDFVCLNVFPKTEFYAAN